MKKTIVLAGLILALGATAFAGPLAGISLVPASGNSFGYFFGWQSTNNWEAIVTKDSLGTWSGDWGILALWNPELWTNGKLKAGTGLILDWHRNGQVTYEDLYLVLGVEQWFSSLAGVYGQLNLSSNYGITPEIGLELRFITTPPITTPPE